MAGVCNEEESKKENPISPPPADGSEKLKPNGVPVESEKRERQSKRDRQTETDRQGERDRQTDRQRNRERERE